MATNSNITTDLGAAMLPLASRFDAAIAAMDDQIAAARALPGDEGDPLVDAAADELDEIVALIAATRLETRADTELALRALAWTVGARSEAEISSRLSREENAADARLLDALFARAVAA